MDTLNLNGGTYVDICFPVYDDGGFLRFSIFRLEENSITQYTLTALNSTSYPTAVASGSPISINYGSYIYFRCEIRKSSSTQWVLYTYSYDTAQWGTTLSTQAQTFNEASTTIGVGVQIRSPTFNKGSIVNLILSPVLVLEPANNTYPLAHLMSPGNNGTALDLVDSSSFPQVNVWSEEIYSTGVVPTNPLLDDDPVIGKIDDLESRLTSERAERLDNMQYLDAPSDYFDLDNDGSFSDQTIASGDVSLSWTAMINFYLAQLDQAITIPSMKKVSAGISIPKHLYNIFCDVSNNILKPAFEFLSDGIMNSVAMPIKNLGFLAESAIGVLTGSFRVESVLLAVEERVNDLMWGYNAHAMEEWFSIDIKMLFEFVLFDVLGLDDGATVYEPFTGFKLVDLESIDDGDWTFDIRIPKVLKNWKVIDGPEFNIAGQTFHIDSNHRGGDVYASDILLGLILYGFLIFSANYLRTNPTARAKLLSIFKGAAMPVVAVTMKAVKSLTDTKVEDIYSEIGTGSGDTLDVKIDSLGTDLDAIIAEIDRLESSLGLRVALGT